MKVVGHGYGRVLSNRDDSPVSCTNLLSLLHFQKTKKDEDKLAQLHVYLFELSITVVVNGEWFSGKLITLVHATRSGILVIYLSLKKFPIPHAPSLSKC